MRCFYSKSSSSHESLKFADLLFRAKRSLGSAYNSFLVSRVFHYLNQARSNFSKREIVLSLFLLLSQATSPDRAIVLGKHANGNLLVPLRYIAKVIFTEESNLFLRANTVDNAIRRSTGATGLEGKTSMLFFKEEPEDRAGYLLYFDLDDPKRRGALSFLVKKLFESIIGFEEKEDRPYRKRALQLVDKHISDRNLIFESKQYLREKLLTQPSITTAYLQNLYRVVNVCHG